MSLCVFFCSKPDDELASVAQGMLDAGAQPTLVASMLHAKNAMVTSRDVYNMKQQSKFKGMYSLLTVNR